MGDEIVLHREAQSYLLLENQMSHASHTSYPLSTFSSRSAPSSLLESYFERLAQDLAPREGQRPRCPYGGESGSGDAAPPGGLCRKQSNRMKLRAKIPHEIIEASFMCEALRHLLLENQMSHASHPQAESKA